LKLDRNIDDEFIYKICRACKVDDIVEKRNLGFNTLIEENGFNISGGEKQRIILARLLLNNSKVFIIDEGLNELDVSLERKILKNVFKIFPDRIFIIISHRLENLDLYNHLLELNDGKIIKDKVYNT
jgi:ABC-type bacteriocin/lantibiotic exporter with double-glycine peptidase domain